jgi:Ran GTPase-activating protein (RanGAP) involved in mRNA processing and transport
MSATTLSNLRIQGHLHLEQIGALSKGLRENTSLLTLDLSRSRLEDFSLLSEGLKMNKSLQNLKLRSIGLKDTHVRELLDSIEGHNTLKSLDVSFVVDTKSFD